MWLRKTLGLLLSFAMAHAAVVRRGVACDKHSSHAAQAAITDHMHSGVDDADAETVPHKVPCDIPVKTKCCDVVTSCAVAFALTSTSTSQSEPIIAAAVVSRIVEIPLSRLVAPDPPPPKG